MQCCRLQTFLLIARLDLQRPVFFLQVQRAVQHNRVALKNSRAVLYSTYDGRWKVATDIFNQKFFSCCHHVRHDRESITIGRIHAFDGNILCQRLKIFAVVSLLIQTSCAGRVRVVCKGDHVQRCFADGIRGDDVVTRNEVFVETLNLNS